MADDLTRLRAQTDEVGYTAAKVTQYIKEAVSQLDAGDLAAAERTIRLAHYPVGQVQAYYALLLQTLDKRSNA